MFQERYNRIILPFFFLIDFCLASGVYYLSQIFFFNNIVAPIDILLIALFWAIPSLYFKSYRVLRANKYISAVSQTFYTWCIFATIFIFSWPLLNSQINNIGNLVFLSLLFFTHHTVSICRFGFFYNYRLKGKNTRNIILIASNISSADIDQIKKDGLHYGYDFVSIIRNTNNISEVLIDKFSMKKIDYVFLFGEGDGISTLVSETCDQFGVRLKLLFNMNSTTGKKVALETIGGFPTIDVRKEPLLYLGNRILKRLLDIMMAIPSIILILSWLPLVVKLAQIISYPGPLFFVQKRVGREGKIFNLYKFRTMVHSSDASIAKSGKSKKTIEHDDRVSWFGRIMRKTNLDEYPQFFNVLLGSMSTVGPRPHMTGEDDILEKNINKYRMRRFVKPGITGLAAIKGFRGGTDDMSLMSKRTEYDIWYLENWSIWLDIKIVMMTIWQMLTLRIPKAY